MWYNLDIDYYFASQKKDKIARFLKNQEKEYYEGREMYFL